MDRFIATVDCSVLQYYAGPVPLSTGLLYHTGPTTPNDGACHLAPALH
jgi:hypothetical protein